MEKYAYTINFRHVLYRDPTGYGLGSREIGVLVPEGQAFPRHHIVYTGYRVNTSSYPVGSDDCPGRKAAGV
jgi:hypothetical protein